MVIFVIVLVALKGSCINKIKFLELLAKVVIENCNQLLFNV